jgi:hypothetical protein
MHFIPDYRDPLHRIFQKTILPAKDSLFIRPNYLMSQWRSRQAPTLQLTTLFLPE